jgi:hypothetical protein
MSDAAHTPSREEEMLARLAELDLAAAEKAHAKLMAAEDASEITELGRTYQRMSRSLRQTLALKAKLARERETAAASRPPRREAPLDHEDLRFFDPQHRARIEQAVAAARPYVERERPDYDELDDIEIYEVLLDLAEEPDFLDLPIETLVARVLQALCDIPLGSPLPELRPRRPAPADRPIQDSA